MHGALTQTSISAWFASVPIVLILRHDHWNAAKGYRITQKAPLAARREVRADTNR